MKPIILLILDGYGIAPPGPDNAVATAKTPTIKHWQDKCSTSLEASGEAVGLPPGQMGSSEVNHLNMGAGRVVLQDITRINKAFADGSFHSNKVINEVFEKGKKIHLLGLVSDGGVHSHIDHLEGLIKLAKEKSCEIVLHAITDGRDTAPRCASKYLERLENEGITIATVMGRFYAMDRDHRWDRTHAAYNALIGENTPKSSWRAALEQAYSHNLSDEFVPPAIVDYNPIGNDDTVIFFNFRSDRTRQITEAFIEKDFKNFQREKRNVHFVSLTEYDKGFDIPIILPPLKLENVLAEWLSKHDKKQVHIAETEKYAHVTFFFNGGVEKPFPNEERVIVPSPKVRTYDLEPRMSVDKITAKVREFIAQDAFDVYIVNFANADMVGHSGDFNSTITAICAIEDNVKYLVSDVLEKDGTLIITADHGNAEEMSGEHQTSHTLNKVPFIIIDNHEHKLHEGIIPDIAPTLLALLGLAQPPEMTGKNLLT